LDAKLMRVDHAAKVAEFLDTEAVGWSPERVILGIAARWPDLTRNEYLRGLDIAIEIRMAMLAEHRALAPARFRADSPPLLSKF
jgi:hypothetical protein